MDGFLFNAFVYLCAAVIAVPLAKRLGLGSVLGYIIAGILIGPVIGLVGTETEDLQHFAEFGVVMMLFLVGLEMEPRTLWEMRARLLGLGGLQVGVSVAAISVIAWWLGARWSVALACGLILALSSTAIVLQTLSEKGLVNTEGGNASFSVLLFQDVAVIPILALIPLLALPGLAADGAPQEHAHADTWVAALAGWQYAAVVLGAIAAVIVAGHFLARPLFRFIAATRLREIFTAAALLIVIATALLMTQVGLSPALGTFIAGVVLANSEFRHELESDIEPFKGLLLGLFFITVGAGIDFAVLSADLVAILGLTAGVIAVKLAVLLIVARLFRLRSSATWLFGLGLAQAGEFGFVLLSFSVQNGVVPVELSKQLALVIALSMLLTPALFIVYERLVLPRLRRETDRPPDEIDERGTVIIAGIGRFGQIVNRLLIANGVETVVLDHEATQIDGVRKFGVKSYFGNAARPELLGAAGIETARVLVVAIDDRDRTVQIVEHVKRHYPQVTILARAFDRPHLYLLQRAGADLAVRELFAGSLELGRATLEALGVHPFTAEQKARAFRHHDEQTLAQLYELWDENPDVFSNRAYMARSQERVATLQAAMQADRRQFQDRSDRAWTPPPKNYDEAVDPGTT